jgi:hypothetical protein
MHTCLCIVVDFETVECKLISALRSDGLFLYLLCISVSLLI